METAMAGYSTSNSHRCKTFQFFLFCVPLVFLLWGCGGDTSEPETSGGLVSASGETGSAAFAIQWHTASTDRASAVVRQAIENCTSAGVETITCIVYDSTNNAIANGGPWNCSDHHGTIGQIPAGSNRVLAVLGTSAEGQIAYHGQTAGITITPGIITDAGTIDARPFVPAAPLMDEVWGNRINLSWTWNVLGFSGYRIYRDGVAVGDAATTNYSDTGLNPQTKYCYTISALDGSGHETGQSEQTCVTTSLVSIWYRDSDNDGYGDAETTTQATSQPTGYVADNTDCNDSLETVHPGADEICNGVDDDCDEATDEGVLNTYYLDHDNDKYGDASQTTQSCSVPSGYVTNNTDCNDSLGTIHPGADEICNGEDDDCDTEIDEGLIFNTYYADTDGDGYGDPDATISECAEQPGYVADASDCDDEDPSVNPGEIEVCYDGIDNNCDEAIDEICADINPTSSFTARYIGEQNVLVADANDKEGQPFNSTFLAVKEATSDRVCLEFDISSRPVPNRVTLDFQLSNLDAPELYSEISLYRYNANGLANAEDYFQVTPSERIDTFSDYPASGTNWYSIDITTAYRTTIKLENTYMGILLKADDTNARYYVYNPVLTLSY
jgi:hypothetical protein